MKRVFSYCLMLITFIVYSPMYGQDSLGMLNLLKGHGFQNLRIHKIEDNSWRIDLENGRYRFTPYGLIQLLNDWESPGQTFHFVFREKDIPVTHLTVGGNVLTKLDWKDEWLDEPIGKPIQGTGNFWQFNVPVGLAGRYTIGHFVNHSSRDL